MNYSNKIYSFHKTNLLLVQLLFVFTIQSCSHEECALCTNDKTAEITTICESEGLFSDRNLGDKIDRWENDGYSCDRK